MLSSDIKQRILTLAQDTPELDSLWLYGSHAKGTASEYSDIDLAVLFKETESDPLKRRLRPELLALSWIDALGMNENELSIIDIQLAPPPLSMAVLQTGVELLSKDRGHTLAATGRIMSKWELDYQYHYRHFD